jgi:uncharacterized protein (TIGR03067 family)
VRAISLAILALVALAAAPADTSEDDKENIQGTWVLTEVEENGEVEPRESAKARDHRMILEENRVYIKSGDKTVSVGTFRIDPAKTPKVYDRAFSDGSPRKGIYKLEKDTLTICLGGLKKDRPKSFTTKAGYGSARLFYKRETATP